MEALLLDIGDVITENRWLSLDEFETAIGRPVPGRGPLDPNGDPIWARHLAGELTIGEYWDTIAARVGYGDWKELFRAILDAVPDGFADPEAVSLIRDAHAAGYKVGVLTNDGVAINGREFFTQRPEFADLDAFVDAREYGEAKPAPGPYLRAAEALGVDPTQVVFLDDTLACVHGAVAVGMAGVLVDPLVKGPAFERARELLGLTPLSRARRLVRDAERAYASQDLDVIMRLFHSDIVIAWNGERVAVGLEEARCFHRETLRLGGSRFVDYEVTKTLRAAEGDTICIESTSSYRTADAQRVHAAAGEFWTMRGDWVIEWHAYDHRAESA